VGFGHYRYETCPGFPGRGLAFGLADGFGELLSNADGRGGEE
jgi:hypothetical protein